MGQVHHTALIDYHFEGQGEAKQDVQQAIEDAITALPGFKLITDEKERGAMFQRANASQHGVANAAQGDHQAETFATFTTKLMKFTDDVAFSFQTEGEALIVRAYSVSRVGGSDLGANQKHIRAVMNRIKPAHEWVEQEPRTTD